jgi:hypothetical protein
VLQLIETTSLKCQLLQCEYERLKSLYELKISRSHVPSLGGAEEEGQYHGNDTCQSNKCESSDSFEVLTSIHHRPSNDDEDDYGFIDKEDFVVCPFEINRISKSYQIVKSRQEKLEEEKFKLTSQYDKERRDQCNILESFIGLLGETNTTTILTLVSRCVEDELKVLAELKQMSPFQVSSSFSDSIKVDGNIPSQVEAVEGVCLKLPKTKTIKTRNERGNANDNEEGNDSMLGGDGNYAESEVSLNGLLLEGLLGNAIKQLRVSLSNLLKHAEFVSAQQRQVRLVCWEEKLER